MPVQMTLQCNFAGTNSIACYVFHIVSAFGADVLVCACQYTGMCHVQAQCDICIINLIRSKPVGLSHLSQSAYSFWRVPFPSICCASIVYQDVQG